MEPSNLMLWKQMIDSNAQAKKESITGMIYLMMYEVVRGQ